VRRLFKMLNIKEKNRIEKYSAYTPKIAKILFDYFNLPDLQVKIDNNFNNCQFAWDNFSEKAYRIRISIDYIEKSYTLRKNYFEDRHNIKINTFLDIFLIILLHEIGHYYYFTDLGYKNYSGRSYQQRYKKHDIRLCEKDADEFAENKFSGAKLFLQEVLK